jgi:Glycosyltransferase WbsX
MAEGFLTHDYRHRLIYRGVYPSWDNTARVAGRGLITLDSTPENYERWLNRATHRTVLERLPSQRLLFINAWNEWAEGCHLEPDRKYGSAYLEATLRVKERRSLLDTPFPSKAALAQSDATFFNEQRRALGTSASRPSIRHIARLLQKHPRLYHMAQIVWRDILALRARVRPNIAPEETGHV